MKKVNIFLFVVAIVLLFSYFLNKKDEKINTEEPKENIGTVLPADSHVQEDKIKNKEDDTQVESLVYTSKNLGIEFNYAKYFNNNFEIRPTEEDNTIYIKTYDSSGVVADPGHEYVKVFQRLEGESIEQALKRIFSKYFENPHCGIVFEKGKYYIWDTRIPFSYQPFPNFDGTEYEKYYDTFCYARDVYGGLVANPDFLHFYYAVTSVPHAPAYPSGIQNQGWYGTIRFIPRVQ